MRKKKILLMTNWCLNKTGFARFAKALLTYLYKTQKYEIIHVAAGVMENSPDLLRCPWKSYGTISIQKLQELKNQHPPHAWPEIERVMSYGTYALDEIVRKEQPDVVLLAEDIWGINWATKFDWFKKIPTVLWTTLDSRPILPTAIESAKECKHFWSWADFATIEMHKMGLTHVKTVPGCIDTHNFFPLSESKKNEIRNRVGLKKEDFIIGMVGRNQLRKGFPNIIEGYSIFKKENPEIKNTKLFFHTSWGEGWNIHKYCEQFGINKSEVVTTYICPHCGNYEIKEFTGHYLDCRFCGVKGVQPNTQPHLPQGAGQLTTNPAIGVTEPQLNEIYNILDFYLQVITSGGLEIPTIENLLASTAPVAMTNYSCGEDYCNDPNSGVLALDWDKYLEGTGTDFIKSWTKPFSIAKAIKKIYNLNKQDKQEIVKRGREWCLKKFGPETIGNVVSELVDSSDFSKPEYFENKILKKNPHYIPSNNTNIEEWVEELYINFFGRSAKEGDQQGLAYWKNELIKGKSREEIISIFRQISFKEEQDQKKITIEDLLDKKDKKRLLINLPRSAGDVFLSTSTLKSLRVRYPKPDWTIYYATEPEYFSILKGNPNIDKIIPYSPQLENYFWLVGNANNNGYFEVVYNLGARTQKLQDYSANGKDILGLNLKENNS